MFCENCGKPNADNAAFCEHCGARLSPAVAPAPAQQQAAPAPAPAPKAGIAETTGAFFKKNKWALPALIGVVAVVIVVAIIAGTLSKQVKVSNYLDVTVSGYDGYGTLEWNFDRSSLMMRVLGDKQYKGYGDFDEHDFSEEQFEELRKKYAKKWEKAAALCSNVKIDVELPEGKTSRSLSNGDVVHFTITCDEKIAKALGVTVKATTYEYKVENLQEVKTLDALENFDLVFSGYDGHGTFEIECTKAFSTTIGDITFEADAGEDMIRYTVKDGYSGSIWIGMEDYNVGELKNGDKLTMRVENDEDDFATYGVILTGLSKEVTVSGLKEMTQVDLLSHFTVQFTGLDGSGKAEIIRDTDSFTEGEYTFDLENQEISHDGSRLCSFYIQLSDSYYLTTGETITLSISANERTLAENGLEITQYSKEIPVTGLAHYATDVKQVENGVDDITAKGMQTITDWLNDNWSYAVHDSFWGNKYTDQSIGDDMALYKMILTTPKSSESRPRNTLWLIYSVTLQDSSMEAPTVYYFAVKTENVAAYDDGTVLADGSLNRYTGVTSYEELYDELIEAYNVNIFESENQ